MRIHDPRYYQLAVQGSLLLWGMIFLGISLSVVDMLAVWVVALGTQWILTHHYQLAFNPLSAINSSMSILLLLHATQSLWLVLAIVLAISSKFFIRWNHRHIFNPSNIGIVAVLLLTDSAWITSGQWGQTMWWAILLLGLGLLFFIGISRLLSSLSFLFIFALLIILRAVWLGDTWNIPLHQLQSGALLVFTFFMLSDPMTTPDSRMGRILFGSMVALIAWVLQFIYYIPNAFLYALALSSPFVLIINKISWGKHYHWPHYQLGEHYANTS
jgi:hypothetical protein